MARSISISIVFVLFALIGVQNANAQTTGARPQPTGARPQPTPARTQPATTSSSTTVNVPATKVAVIFSADFQDAKTGIAKYIVTINKLNAEFLPTQNELNATAQRLNQLQAEINNNTTLTPAQLQAKIDQLDQQKKAYQRKGEDAQTSYQKRRSDLLGPLQEEVGRALDAYAQAHGITMVMDGSRVPILYAAVDTDITKAFIADYNSKNPATATTATPK